MNSFLKKKGASYFYRPTQGKVACPFFFCAGMAIPKIKRTKFIKESKNSFFGKF
jgi:hypothetical protein